MNYGALGSVVGHELTHGFMFDPDQTDGDIVWSQETAQKFQEKIQCVLDDYDNYTEHLSEFTVMIIMLIMIQS
jgi:predicted metalloendopeptidase